MDRPMSPRSASRWGWKIRCSGKSAPNSVSTMVFVVPFPYRKSERRWFHASSHITRLWISKDSFLSGKRRLGMMCSTLFFWRGTDVRYTFHGGSWVRTIQMLRETSGETRHDFQETICMKQFLPVDKRDGRESYTATFLQINKQKKNGIFS